MSALNDMVFSIWKTATQMAPYLLLGFAAAGIMAAFLSPTLIKRHLGAGGMLSVVKASLLGVPLPLCSCGVIPVAFSLRKGGASRGATLAFLISTPQTGVDSIAVTYGMLGPIMAVIRPAAAFLTGLLGGCLAEKLEPSGTSLPDPEKMAADAGSADASAGRQRWWQTAFQHGFVSVPRDTAKPIVFGLIISGALAALLPDDFFAGSLGRGPLAILVMILAGIPVYVCATASVPIAAVLILKGVSPGAALAFLISGPATNMATVAMIWTSLGPRSLAAYLASIAASAFGLGLLLDALPITQQVQTAAAMACHGETSPAGIISALLLAAVLFPALWHDGRRLLPRPSAAGRSSGRRIILAIEGMSCEHCASTVRTALLRCSGVAHVEVDRLGGTASIAGGDMNIAEMTEAVRKAGYNARPVPADRE